MKALVWEHDLLVKEVPIPPIPEGWVLGKVLTAMLSPIDRSVTAGVQPTPPGRILGSYGVIRVVEPGINSEVNPGEIFGVQPYCNENIVGVEINGVLSDYASVPTSCLVKIRNELSNDHIPLWIEFSFLKELSEIAEDSNEALIVGCTFTSYVIASELRKKTDVTVGCVERALMKDIAELGVTVKKIVNVEGEKYDLVVLEPTSAYYSMKAVRMVKDDGIMYIPPSHPRLLLDYGGFPRHFSIIRASLSSLESGKTAIENLHPKVLKSAVVTTDNFEEIPSLAKFFGRVIYVRKKRK